MSMNTYPMVERAAFYIDSEVAAHIILMDCQKNDSMSDTLKSLVVSDEFDAAAKENRLPMDMYDMSAVVDILQSADMFLYRGLFTTSNRSSSIRQNRISLP